MAENTDPYKQSLDSRALSVATLLEKLRKSLTYNSIQKTTPALSENDIALLLDPERIPWQWLRKEVLTAIAANRAKTKGQVASATKRYTKKCRSL
jgi:predicted metal-dependent peptidase